MFDSPAIESLFANHLDLLLQTKNHRVPMFRTASRGGSSVLQGLDTLLTRGDPPRPAYFSSLDEAQNAAVRTNYDDLRTPEDRRDRLVQVIGESYRAHLGRLQKYFEENPTGTVHDVSRVVTPSLFDRVYSLAEFIVKESHEKSLQPYVAVTVNTIHRRPYTRESGMWPCTTIRSSAISPDIGQLEMPARGRCSICV